MCKKRLSICFFDKRFLYILPLKNKIEMKVLKKYGGIIVCLLLLVATLPLNPFFCHNQNTYFLKGFYQAGFLQEDWLASCLSTATEFDAIVSFVVKYFPENYALIFQFLFAIFYFVFVYFLYKIIENFSNPTIAVFTISLTSLLCFSETFYYLLSHTSIAPYVAYIPYTGLAGFSLVSYLQPSTFGILLIPTIFNYINRKYVIASFLIMVTCLFHTTYILFGGLTIVLIFYELIQEKKWDRLIMNSLVIFPFSIIIFVQLLPFIISEPSVDVEGKRILIEEISPQHHIVSKWVVENRSDWIRIILLCIGGLIFPKRLKKLFLITAGGALLLTIGQHLTLNATLSIVSPWRMSVIWIPICSAFIFLFLVEEYLKLFRSKSLVLIAVILFSGAVYVKWFSKDVKLTLPRLSAISSLEGALLIPPRDDWGERSQNIRLNYLSPVFVDAKSHPYDPKGLIEWKDRIDLAEQFYDHPSKKNLQAILNREEINYIIWPEKLHYKPMLGVQPKSTSKAFSIYEITPFY